MRLVWFSLALLSLSNLHAAEAILNAPDRAPACAFVLLDGSGSTCTDCLRWTVSDPEVSVFTDQRSRQIVVWSDKPRHVGVILTAVDKTGKRSVATKVIEFTGDPDDATPPTPEPRPDDPAKPDDRPLQDPFAIKDQIITEATKLPAETRAKDAEALIAEVRKLRKKFADGEIGPRDSLKISRAVSTIPQGLPPDTAQRTKGFGEWWAGALYRLYSARQIMTKEDWLLLLDLTIQALRMVL